MPTLEQLLGGAIKIGNTTYKLDEVKDGRSGNIIWPLNITYAILSNTITLRYSSGTQILANGSNYAYITATVQVYRGTTIIQTLTNQVLNITTISDTSRFRIVDGNKVYGQNMGVMSFPTGLSCTVTRYGYGDVSITDRNQTVMQEANTSTITSYDKVYTGYEIALSDTSLSSTGGTVDVVGRASYDSTPIYTWTSGSSSRGRTTYDLKENQIPTSLTVIPAGATVNAEKTQITFPANTGTSDISYTVTGVWGGFNSVQYVTVGVITYTYEEPVVTLIYEDLGVGYQVGAGQQTVYPLISFSQKRTSSLGEVVTISGSLSGGATSGIASDGSGFSLTMISGTSVSGAGSLSSSNAGVTSVSRGTTEGSARQAARNIYVKLQCHGKTGDSYYNHGFVAVTQQANTKTVTPASTVYSSVVVNGFKINGSTVTSIPNCTRTTVTVDVRASWTETAAKTEYTSGASTGGDQTVHTNEAVTPAQLFVNGTNMGAITSFTATNTHTTSQKTWSVKATYGGLESEMKAIIQAADIQLTGVRNYVATLSVGSNTISASGGSATLYASASHEEYKYWASDNAEISGTSEQKPDGVTIVKRSGGTRFTLSGSTVTHENMAKNQTTDSVVYYARNNSKSSAISSDVTLSATNTRSSTAREAGDWHDVGSKTYGTPTVVNRNHNVSVFSSSSYTSSSSAAPFKGGTFAILSWTATYDEVTTTPWTQSQEGTLYYDYTSGAYDEATGTRTVSGSDVSTVQKNGTPTFSSNQSWLTVSASGVVTIAASTNTSVRNATIIATLGSSSKSVTIYQRRFASISISVDSIIFTKQSGTATFVVSYTNTTFSLSHGGQGDPITGLSPDSGGSATSSGTRTVTVTVGANTGSSNRIGEIVVNPGDSELEDLLIDVLQEGTPASGTYDGFPMVEWATSSRMNYDCLVTNNSSSAKTITATLQVVYTTGDQHPSSGSSISTKTVTGTVDFGATSSIGSGTIYATKMSNRTYWCRLSCELFDSGWEQVEEPES